MAKTLHFDLVEVELSEEEEDQKLLLAMDATKNEPVATPGEASDFENWLNSVK